MKTILTVIVFIIAINGYCDEKSRLIKSLKTEARLNINSKEKFSDHEIVKYTISSVMNQSPSIITVTNNNEVFYASYVRKTDNKKFDYKIKFDGNNIIWGNKNGRWRDSKFDEKITYSEKGNVLKIIQVFNDGSKIVKEFTK